MIRLAAFDLDGTLMGEEMRISPGVRAAVSKALDQGLVVTLATGRMFAATRPYAELLNITAPLICYQGGWIQALDDAAPRHRVALPLALARQVLDLSAASGWHTVVYAEGRVFVDALRYPRHFYDSLLGEGYAVGLPWDQVLDGREPDKVLFAAEPDIIPGIERALRARFADGAEIVRSHAKFVEIVPRGVSKGAALAWLAGELGVPQAQVLAVGDQGNDLSMVEWAGVGVAMGNATAAIKAAADWVAPPLDEDGAAAALERFALEGAGS